MKRLLGIVLATALAIACLGGPALAGGSDAANGGGWFDNSIYEFKFNFHAKTLPDGSARGELRWWNTEEGFVAQITVSCLEVDGDTALLGGIITSSTDSSHVGRPGTMPVKDGGEGAKAGPDMAGWVLIDQPPCTHASGFVPVIKGNIQVKDR